MGVGFRGCFGFGFRSSVGLGLKGAIVALIHLLLRLSCSRLLWDAVRAPAKLPDPEDPKAAV